MTGGPRAASVAFHSERIKFELKNRSVLRDWICSVIQKEGRQPGELTYIFCSDAHLLKMNVKYLKHKTLTDIITFDYSEGKAVSGDIFISIPRVRENARKYGAAFEHELARVMVHGALHLIGYTDKKPSQKSRMRAREDHYLGLLAS